MSSETRKDGHPGPDPERLNVQGPWEDAAKKVVRKKPEPEQDVPEERKGSED